MRIQGAGIRFDKYMNSLFEHLDLAVLYFKVADTYYVITDITIIYLSITVVIALVCYSCSIDKPYVFKGKTRNLKISRLSALNSIQAQGYLNKYISLIDSGLASIAKPHMGWNYYRYRAIIITLALTLFLANITSVIPGIYPVTALFILPLMLSSLVNLPFTIYGFIKDGLGFLKFLLPIEVYPEPIGVRLLFPFCELLSYLVRFLTLPLRVSCSMFTGHLMIEFLCAIIFGTLSNGGLVSSSLGYIVWILLLLVLVVEVLAAVAQTYIFVLLSAYYIGGNLSERPSC